MTFCVNISPQAAIAIIKDYVENSISGECIDEYTVYTPDGKKVSTCVLEKHYFRAGNRLTLTVIADDVQKQVTTVHCISGGGGEGLFKFDWGAEDSFEDCAIRCLNEYIIK